VTTRTRPPQHPGRRQDAPAPRAAPGRRPSGSRTGRTTAQRRPRAPAVARTGTVQQDRDVAARRARAARQRSALQRSRASIASGRAARRSRRRLFGFVVVLFVLFGLVVSRLADLQVLNARRYVAYGDRQRLRSRQLPAARGSLLDRNGQVLAMSIPQRTVYADPKLVAEPATTARRLAPLLGIDAQRLRRGLTVPGRFSILAHTVPDATAERIARLQLPGVGTYDEFKRYEPGGALARSLIGGVSSDGGRGTSGVEAKLDRVLTGRPGRLVFEEAHGGGTIAGGRRTVRDARPGANVSLTIDQALQYETERALSEQVLLAKARGGMAIISRPSTGEVLAMANVTVTQDGASAVPSGDNIAVTAQFEPGSVNKVITIAGAMEEGLVRPDTVFDVPDTLQVSDHLFRDHDPHPIRRWTVTDILAASSNVGTIELAQRLGPDRIDRYLRAFGFGTRTALGFPYETGGQLLDPAQWSGTSIGAIPIGQGVAVTAMQILAAYNVVANDGVYVAPKLVAQVDRGDGGRATPPSPTRRVISPETARAMRGMMAQVVKSGTGQSAVVAGYPTAGKTGTARKPQPLPIGPGVPRQRDGYKDAQGNYHYVSTFAGFLPANHPDLSIVVVIDEPTTSIFASDVSAPVFSRLASYALRLLRIPPPPMDDLAAFPGVPEVSPDARQHPNNDVTVGGRPPVTSTSSAPAPVATGATAATSGTDRPTVSAGSPPSSAPRTTTTLPTTGGAPAAGVP